MGDDPARLDTARTAILTEMGPEALVDAAGVAAMFNAVDRVADASGIPVERGTASATEEMREELGLEAGQVDKPQPFCLMEDSATHVLDIGFLMRTPLSRTAILTCHDHKASDEYLCLEVVARAELEAFLDTCRQRCVNVGARYVLARSDVPVEQTLATVLTSARRKGWT